jgi:predicted acetyltransferase
LWPTRLESWDDSTVGRLPFYRRPSCGSILVTVPSTAAERACVDTQDLWVRLLDVPAALAARRYATRDRLVLEVVDQLRPANHGNFALEGSPEGASCRRTDADPDLRLDVAELGAVYLGGVRFTTLAAAGRLTERTPGALWRADRLFASDPAPWCTTQF